MKPRKKKSKVPIELIAVRRADREIDRMLHGDGFHARTRVKKSKKLYTRKRKHRNLPE